MKWHLAFILPYLGTFVIGLFRDTSLIAYKIHPFVGMASLIIPLLVYISLPNKRVIHQMIKSNFSKRCEPLMRVARISTLVIIFYYILSVLSGVVLNLGLYGTPLVYQILASIHGVARIIVPLAVVIHVVTRLMLKRNMKKRRHQAV